MVDTMGHLLWTDVRTANVADGKAGVLVWEQAEDLDALLDKLVLMDADSTFGERTILSAQTFIWMAHTKRTTKRVWD